MRQSQRSANDERAAASRQYAWRRARPQQAVEGAGPAALRGGVVPAVDAGPRREARHRIAVEPVVELEVRLRPVAERAGRGGPDVARGEVGGAEPEVVGAVDPERRRRPLARVEGAEADARGEGPGRREHLPRRDEGGAGVLRREARVHREDEAALGDLARQHEAGGATEVVPRRPPVPVVVAAQAPRAHRRGGPRRAHEPSVGADVVLRAAVSGVGEVLEEGRMRLRQGHAGRQGGQGRQGEGSTARMGRRGQRRRSTARRVGWASSVRRYPPGAASPKTQAASPSKSHVSADARTTGSP